MLNCVWCLHLYDLSYVQNEQFSLLYCSKTFLSDDLLSLLDSGIHSDHPGVIIESDSMFNEDMFGYSALRVRSSLSRANRSGMKTF